MTVEDMIILRHDNAGKPESWLIKRRKMMENWEKYLFAVDDIIEQKKQKNQWVNNHTGALVSEIYKKFTTNSETIFKNLLLMCVNQKRQWLTIRQYGRSVVVTPTEFAKKFIESERDKGLV